MKYAETLKKVTDNITSTQNGDVAFKSYGDKIVDMFYKIGALREQEEYVGKLKVEECYKENPEATSKILLYARDIRNGMGERSVVRDAIVELSENHPNTMLNLVSLLPEIGRWDDVIYIWYHTKNQALKDSILVGLKQILKMEENKEVEQSLLAKWLPSENATNKHTILMAKALRKALGMTPRNYRKMLTKMRSNLNLVENNLRTREYEKINYEQVPSLAHLKYECAFEKNDNERYTKYLDNVNSGKSKMNTQTLTPFDIIRKIDVNFFDALEDAHALNLAWDNLPDVFEGKTLNAIVACDVSGSMHGDPLSCSVGLAIYMAQRNKGAFHNYFIDFCGNSRMHQLKEGVNIVELYKQVTESSEDCNTNMDSVFNALLRGATYMQAKQEDLPEYIIIVSDMQFDQVRGYDTAFERAKKNFEEAGYKLPTIIFWNVNLLEDTIPATSEDNVILVSGRSQNVIKELINVAEAKITDNRDLTRFIISNICKSYEVNIVD